MIQISGENQSTRFVNWLPRSKTYTPTQLVVENAEVSGHKIWRGKINGFCLWCFGRQFRSSTPILEKNYRLCQWSTL